MDFNAWLSKWHFIFLYKCYQNLFIVENLKSAAYVCVTVRNKNILLTRFIVQVGTKLLWEMVLSKNGA